MAGFKVDKIILALLLLSGTILFGTAGYYLIDHYPLLDALYMSVITITTVGFGETHPLSQGGRLFTVALILLGFVVLGFVGHSLAASLLEKVWSGNSLERRMKKKIAALQNHYILCGFGRVGEVASQHLAEAGVDFIVIDPGLAGVEQGKEPLFPSIQGDATREQVLLQAGIKRACGLLALVDSDPLNLFIALTARELNPTLHIIARSEEKETANKILRAGADAIISPFDSAGRRIADDLLAATGRGDAAPDQTDSAPGSCRPSWILVNQVSGLAGKSVAEGSRLLKGTIVGVRRGDLDLLQPDQAMMIRGDDQLMFIAPGAGTELDRGLPVPRKIVIVDDNPVIARLFTRLFQKEGYHPLSVDNGEEGFELILRERPVAAVIDYMLPGISGLDVCRRLQAISFEQQLKIVIFTAEDDPELREQCLAAGADAVIVKSADAAEIIQTVGLLIGQGGVRG